MDIALYETGQEVDVIVCTKRGKEAEWLPAIVYSVSADLIDVQFDSGVRQRFHRPFDDRIKPRGQTPPVTFKV